LDLGPATLSLGNRRKEKAGKKWLDPYLPELLTCAREAPLYAFGAEAELAFALFLPYVDELWVNDEFQPARIERLIRRLKAIRSYDIGNMYEWRRHLTRIESEHGPNYDSKTLEVAGFLVQIHRLFAGDQFDPAEAHLLLTRLSSLDSARAVDLAKVLEIRQKRVLGGPGFVSTRQAAILLIQADELFTGNELRREVFESALRRLAR
jgi:hypothetical protein